MREEFNLLGSRHTGESETVGSVSSIMRSPVDSSMFIFLGTHGINWLTEDCLEHTRVIRTGRRLNEFQFHPLERTWLLASAWTECSDFDETPCEIYQEVFYSPNLGQDWSFIANYVVQFSW